MSPDPDDPDQGTAERRLRALLRTAADVTWTAGADRVVRWCETGLAVGPLLGRDAAELVHPGDRSTFLAGWDDVVAGRARQASAEYRLATSDGSLRWVRGTLTDLRDDLDVGALLGHAVDVTASRREGEARRRADAGRLARFEQSSVPQIATDATGRLVDVNDALCALLGRSRDALVGRHVREAYHPDNAETADVPMAAIVTGRRARGHGERVLQRADGTGVPVLVDATALYDEQGEPAGAICLIHDLTALRETERRRQREQELYTALSLRASDLAIVTDVDGTIVYVSPGVSNVFGYAVEDVVGCDGFGFIHPDDTEGVRTRYDQVVREGGSATLLLRVQAADGQWRWVEETMTNLLHTGVGGVVCNLQDVTERVLAEQALRDSEARYRAIADTAEEGIWAVSPDGRTLYANARTATVLGLPLQQLYEGTAGELLDPTGEQGIAGRLRTRDSRGAERYEIAYRHPDGAERRLWIAASPLRTADGVLQGSLAMISDVTEARRNERELQHAALHDSLTGLPNRALLQDRLERALARPGRTTAVLCLDLDQFKQVNDSRGHDTGDQLLRAVAHRLRTAARPHDTVARFSGDEFVVVCEDVDAPRAERLAQDLLVALDEPFELDGGLVHAAASVGVAVSPAASGSDLLRYADMAMYSAKEAGRGRVRLFEHGLAEQAEQHFALAAELRVALAEDGLALHYQPVVDLGTGRVVGMEALARWRHPERGFVPPARFVAVAERSGLVQQLDRWALRRALRDAGRLRDSGALPADAYVAVNLSAHNLGDTDLDGLIAGWAQEAGVPAGQVVLEITETAIMNDSDVAIPLLRTLRGRGFLLAVDDFGTGYSSLAYLRDLPVTSLKIDRSFIADITGDQDARSIVTSIVDLARAVGVTAVAEGVETREQAALLRRLGCQLGQGWLWSAAVPEAVLRGTPSWTSGFPVPPGEDLRASRTGSGRRRRPETERDRRDDGPPHPVGATPTTRD